MAKPPNYKAGACQSSRVSNICYKKSTHKNASDSNFNALECSFRNHLTNKDTFIHFDV